MRVMEVIAEQVVMMIEVVMVLMEMVDLEFSGLLT